MLSSAEIRENRIGRMNMFAFLCLFCAQAVHPANTLATHPSTTPAIFRLKHHASPRMPSSIHAQYSRIPLRSTTGGASRNPAKLCFVLQQFLYAFPPHQLFLRSYGLKSRRFLQQVFATVLRFSYSSISAYFLSRALHARLRCEGLCSSRTYPLADLEICLHGDGSRMFPSPETYLLFSCLTPAGAQRSRNQRRTL